MNKLDRDLMEFHIVMKDVFGSFDILNDIKNPPDINAQIFREVLDSFSTSFDEIIFAIPDNTNFQIFKDNLFDLDAEEKERRKYNL